MTATNQNCIKAYENVRLHWEMLGASKKCVPPAKTIIKTRRFYIIHKMHILTRPRKCQNRRSTSDKTAKYCGRKLFVKELLI